MRATGGIDAGPDALERITDRILAGKITRPMQLLEHALDLVDVGQVPAADRPAALAVAWAAVHGLATLLLGPLAELTPDAQNAAIELTMQTYSQDSATRPTRKLPPAETQDRECTPPQSSDDPSTFRTVGGSC